MTKVISINELGGLMLPRELWERLGLSAGGSVVAETTSEGVLLRAGSVFPVENYSEERLAEFKRNNEDALAGYRLGR